MVTPPRTTRPLPRYVERKPTKAGWAYFWHVPSWAKKAGCLIYNEPLGLNYEGAVERAETILLPAFDSWRTGDGKKQRRQRSQRLAHWIG